MKFPIDLHGHDNGFVKVIAYYGQTQNRRHEHLWVCECRCGNTFNLITSKIKSAVQKTCGDLKNHPPKHGLTKRNTRFHPIYRLWCNMKKRCYNPSEREYPYYKGKGIKVCDEWLNDAKKFFDWAISHGWIQGLSIDRIDPDGDYEPNNCEFITRSENTRRAAVKYWNRVR